jgi:sugar phosphate permease
MTDKQSALWGNILTTVGFLVLVGIVTISVATDELEGAFAVGQMIGLVLRFACHVMAWLAYVMIGKEKDKGWKIYLLVLGIVWGLGSFFTVLSLVTVGLNISALVGLVQLAGCVFFILAFALKGRDKTSTKEVVLD